MPWGLLGGIARGLLSRAATWLGLGAATLGIERYLRRRQEKERQRQQASRQYQRAYQRNPLEEAVRRATGRPPRIPENPLYTASSEVANWPRRLRAAGIEAPPPEQIPRQRGLLERISGVLEPLFRPGRAAGTFYAEVLRGTPARQALRRARAAFYDPSQALMGQDVLRDLARRSRVARFIYQRPLLRATAGLLYDVYTDPVSHVTIWTRPVRAAAQATQAAEQAGRRILMVQPGRLVRTRVRGGRLGEAQRAQRALRRRYFVEVVEEGGQRRLRRLSPQELPREWVTGRTEARVRDRVADMLLQRRLQRLEQQGLRSLPVEVRQAMEARARRQATRRITEVIPQQAPPPAPQMRTTIRFGGVDILDITPIRTALGAVIQRVPGLTRLQDSIGRHFVLGYVPRSLPETERQALKGAFESVLQTVRRTGAEQSRIIRDIARGWREAGLSPEVARRVPELIEQTAKIRNPMEEAAVQRVRQFFKEQVDRLHRMGVPVRVLQNYIPHIYENPAQARRALEEIAIQQRQAMWRGQAQAGRSLAARGRPSFLQQRFIDTLEEAERKYQLRPVRDARVLMGVYAAMVEQVRALRSIARDLVHRQYIVSSRPVPGFKQLTPDSILGEVIPELRGKWIHPEVDRMLTNVMPVLLNRDDALAMFFQHVNRLTDILKTMWLPADVVRFNLQQLIGNVTLNIADGMFDPRRYTQAALILTERGRRVMPVVRLAGREIPTEQIYQWFREAGLEGTGRASTFRSQRSLVAEARRAVRQEDLGPVRYLLTAEGAQHALWSLPEAIDNVSRMANFLHHLATGKTWQQAAEATRRALGDYSMLTLTERGIRSFVWFYPWLRFAIPRMIERIIGAPGLLTGWAHVQANFIRLSEDQYRQLGFGEIDVDQLLPDWAKRQGAIPIGVDDQGNLRYIISDVPITELANLPDPTSLSDVVNWVLQQVPPLTLLAPWLTGVDPTTQQPITETPMVPEAARQDRIRYLLRQLGPLGRAAAVALGLDQESQNLRAAQTAMQQGEVPFIDPALRPRERVFGVVRTVHPSYAQATQLFQARDYYRQLAQAAERQGIVIPDIEDIRRQEVLGNPLEAAVNQALIRAGHPPIEARPVEGGNPLERAVIAAQIQRAGENVPGFIYEAMRITGVGEDWAPYLNYLMRTSSGGRVTLVGPPTPTGERLLGAFQMPPSVFQRYALPGMQNPFNPLHNAVAFIRFVRDRYGHPAMMPELAGR